MVLLKLIAFVIFVPLMTVVSLAFLAAAILFLHLGVMQFGNKFSAWLDRQFGESGIFMPDERPSSLSRLVYGALAAVFAVMAYWFMRWGVVNTLANYAFFLS